MAHLPDPAPTLADRHAVVIGGGITGLATALVLGRRGARVTVLERDAEGDVPTPADAFAHWERPGAPQVRHSHIFLGRLRNLLRDHYPDLLQAFLASGARELHMIDRPPLPLWGLAAAPGDEDLVALACRRTTFEWVLRRHVVASGTTAIVPRATVTDLVATPGDPPAVTGVCYTQSGTEHRLAADLVIDASGRRSAAPAWLHAIGARPVIEENETSGIVYYTRFYRLRPGAVEPEPNEHPGANDFNWVKYAIFPADNQTFSITLAVPLAFPRLKVLARTAAFDEMVRRIPGIAPWADPAIAEPIGDAQHPVQAMGGLINRLRRFVDPQGPLALGFFVLGDAVYCTNPLYGRGCTQGVLHAHFLGEALDRYPDDLAASARQVDQRARDVLEPFYRASVLADRDATRRAEGRVPSTLKGRLQQRFFERGIGVAMRCDPVVFRAFTRMMNMLETPEQAFGQRSVVLRSAWVMARGQRYNRRYLAPLAPDKETTIASCEAAAAR